MSRPRNIGNAVVKLPANPQYINFERSDGDRRTWPPNVTRVVGEDGELNWMDHVILNHQTSLKWRMKVGELIAKDKGWPRPEQYILQDWPADYRMYDHNKGPANGIIRHDIYLYGPPGKRFRSINEFLPHAIWLCNDETLNPANCLCKYCSKRSQKEISSVILQYAHAPSATPSSSAARAAASVSVSTPVRPSGEGTANAAAGPSTQPQASQGGLYTEFQKRAHAVRELSQRGREHRHREPRHREPRHEPQKAYAAVQKALRPSPNVLSHPMLVERNQDLRAVYSRSANGKADSEGQHQRLIGPGKHPYALRRWFREKEVVWCRLPEGGFKLGIDLNGVSEGGEEADKVEFWPGIVDYARLKALPVPRETHEVEAELGTGNVSNPVQDGPVRGMQNAHSDPALTETERSVVDDPSAPLQRPPSRSSQPPPPPDVPTPWVVEQYTIYHVRLLGGTTELDVEDEYVLPYLAYSPPSLLISYIKRMPVENMDFDREHVAKFNPVQMSKGQGGIVDRKGKGKAKEVDINEMEQGADEAPQTGFAAAAAFALAVQIASNISNYWALTDKWEFEYAPQNSSASPAKTANTATEANTNGMEGAGLAAARNTTIALADGRGGLSLHSAIEAAGRHNALNKAHPSSLSPPSNPTSNSISANVGNTVRHYTHHDISSVDPTMSSDQVRQLAVRHLGVGRSGLSAAMTAASAANFGSAMNAESNSVAAAINLSASTNARHTTNSGGAASSGSSGKSQESMVQIRFQGMWWGPERIWVDDFVRLKMSRGALARDGAPNILKPSGPGKGKLELYRKMEAMLKEKKVNGDHESAEMEEEALQLEDVKGATTRGLFMQIGGLIVIDVPKEDGRTTKKEARVCGMLYELADADWEEDDDDGWAEGNGGFNATVNEAILPPPTREGAAAGPPSTQPSSAAIASKTPPPLPSGDNHTSLQPSPPGNYLLPQAPNNYRFRPILKPGFEVVMSLAMISGRYYPRILSHPLLRDVVRQAANKTRQDMLEDDYPATLFSLEGLHTASYTAVDPIVYKKSRVAMVEDADVAATSQLENYKRSEEMKGRLEREVFGSTDDDGDARMEGLQERASPNTTTSADELQLRLGYPFGGEQNRMDVD